MKRWISVMLVAVMVATLFCACGQTEVQEGLGNGWEPVDTMDLQFATQFSVDYYEGGYKLISISDGSRFLVVPEGKEAPKGIAKDIALLYQPLQNLYLAASASMCLFDALGCMDAISLSGIRQDAWYIENAVKAMDEGKILYAGKYSEPDYEMILDHGTPLAIESTMIGHASEVKEKLEELGIAVLTDYASMEPHPLGRTEWIKLYASLFNLEEKAEKLFQEQVDYMNEAASDTSTGKTVVFFHIGSSGYVVARRSGDYVTKMIELAGGKYAFENLGDPNTVKSTVNMEMETFFATAKDADVVIYNSAIDGEISTIEELLKKNSLLGQFKAVKEGNVWCTSQNMYQETTQLGQMVRSFHQIFTGAADDLDEVPFLTRIK